MCVACPAAIAGKPAPTGFMCAAYLGTTHDLWERACPRLNDNAVFLINW
jgi:hypothetical protein